MIKLNKFISIFFLSLIFLMMSSCVPKATEKKAVCGVNQAFNSTTRSCYSIVAPNKAAVATNITPAAFNEDTPSVITLSYTDVDLDLATTCQINSVTNITAGACTCDALGVCTVTVTGTQDFTGAAQFTYAVKTGSLVSNTAKATLTINPINDAPVISTILAQSTNEDTAKVINFTITDPDNTLSCAGSVSVASTDTTLIPLSNIVVTGTAPNCTATITPALNLSGVSTITLQVTDGILSASQVFATTVVAVNDTPTISPFIATQTTLEDTANPIVIAIADVDSALLCNSTYISVTSSNPLLLPALLIDGVDITYAGAIGACTLTINPIANAYGTTNLTISVNDGSATATAVGTSNIFIFNVTAVNDAPTISNIANDSTLEDVAKAIVFTIADVDDTLTCAGSVTKTSSDTTVVPLANIVITGTAPNCTVTITPAANQSSLTPVTIGLTVTDGGGLTATDSFDFTVNYVDDAPYFNTTITTADTNEGGMVVAGPFKIDEDQASTTSEDFQDIQITSIKSDNQSILPDASNPNITSAIRIFYDKNDNGVEDFGEDRDLSESLDTANPAVDDAHAHSFYLKIYPVAGISGNANITITATDGLTPITSTFALIVHPVAALHGGWSNISAVGIKSDKNGAPISTSDIQCNYNKSTDTLGCDTNQTCTGTSAPNGTIKPDAVNVIFWDSASKKCYRSKGATVFDWVELATSCPISRTKSSPTTLAATLTSTATTMTVASTTGFLSAGTIVIGSEQITYTSKTSTTFLGLVRGVNGTTAAAHTIGDSIALNTSNGLQFIKDSTATPAQVVPTATAVDQYYYDAQSKYCYQSQESLGVYSWNATPFIPSKVTLSWNAFNITGSGADSAVSIYGWYVYRRVAGKDYDFVHGYLKKYSTDLMSITNTTTRTYTDTTATAGKVYYYLVRPVDNTSRKLTISTPEIFSEVRVYAPSENYSFVHRWMANQEVCNSMHMTTTTTNKVDPTHNYRCPYYGPGESLTTPGYYDIGKDMLVDISESGCPYSAAPSCTANGCIGIGAPSGSLSNVSANDVYYDRNSGACYAYTGLTWVSYLTYSSQAAGLQAAMVAKTNTALNAPLTNISSTAAKSICTGRTTNTATTGLTGATPIGTNAATLPTKKEFIAYSAAPVSMTDAVITDMEQGFSLNAQSRCNSAGANGLTVAYTDSSIPSTSYIYSLPGTASSAIRSLYTGSIPWVSNYSTETCSSRYGIQDVYGNVSEWVQDKMKCDNLTTSLISAVIAGDTTINVLTTTGFPTTGTIAIGTEKLAYTGLTATTFTGVTAATLPHAIGVSVSKHAATSTLNGAITNNALSLTVVNAAGFAPSGTIIIENEEMTYSGIAANVFTITARGANGSVAVAHADTSIVRMAYDNYFTCSALGGTDLGNYSFGTNTRYGFDLVTGPLNDTNADSVASDGDAYLTEWSYRDEYYGAGKFSFPIGMPINADIASASSGVLASAVSLPYLLDIGPTAGITTTQLHEDGIIINAASVNSTAVNPTQIGSFAQGGSYRSGDKAGRYTSELIPDNIIGPDIGFRCYIPIVPDNFPLDPGFHNYSY